MDLREFRVVVRIVDRVAKRARFAEKQRVALEGQCAEWKRIADELKAERNAEREQHTAIKQALGIQAAKEAGKVLGMVEGEGLRAAAQRVVKERDALRTECDDLRRVFLLVHGSLGIRQGQHIGNAIDALKKERDELATRLRQSIARGDFAEMRAATLLAELAEQKPSFDPTVAKMESTAEASHITPEGKRTAEGAVTPQPGDVVILVRFPTPKECREWSDEFGKIGELATVMSDDDEPCPFCVSVVRSEGCMNWPLSCVEIVKGVDK